MRLSDEPITEASKAVQEVAKTTSKGIDAAREAGGFVSRFIAGPLEQAMGIYEDKLKYARWERQQRYMARVIQVQKELGLPIPDRPVPLKVAIPLFQGASIEDDNSLQDLWVNLLINAAYTASGIEVKRAYVEILSQISPLEALILDLIYALPFKNTQHNGVITTDLPQRVKVGTSEDTHPADPGEDVELALANLVRIGCIRAGMSFGGGEFFARVNPTVLGRHFVEACRVKPMQAER